jgi:hypothetical protein
MPERYTFPHTLAGLRLALHLTQSLRTAGFTTVCTPGTTSVGKQTFNLLRLEATPAPRPNREARGCNLTNCREH